MDNLNADIFRVLVLVVSIIFIDLGLILVGHLLGDILPALVIGLVIEVIFIIPLIYYWRLLK